jgi:hypothetical protein
MRKNLTSAGAAVFLCLALVVVSGERSPSAHHSLAAEFDESRPLTLTGVVSKVEWYNPHVYLYLDVADEGGKTRTWAVESFPPLTLRRGGLTRDKLGVGEKVTVLAYHARNGKDLAFLRKLTFADGREIVIWLGDIKQAGAN